MKTRIAVVLITSILLLSGCANFISLTSNNSNPKGSNITKNTTTNSSLEELTIYKISSDTFDSMLESNSFESIKNCFSEHYSYPKDGNRYITYNTVPFLITDDFVDFINDKSRLEEFFFKGDTDKKIESLTVFEAPYVPVSVWLKTNKDTYFFTVNEENFNTETEYVYNLYTLSEYIEKYQSKQFKLEINGSIASNGKLIKTYYQHSELPLLEILSACGSKIAWKSKDQVSITINKKNYLLDVKNNRLYQKHDKKNNILAGCSGGGPYNMYFSDEEYYVDSDTLQYVLLELGQKISIEYDTEQKIVNIVTK